MIFISIILNSSKNEKVEINKEDIVMNYFYLKTCPHCIKQAEFHKKLLEKYPNLKIVKYELTQKSSKEKLFELFKELNQSTENVFTPTTIIGEQINIGFESEEKTGKKLIQMIENEISKQE